jgi:branched-chain amino acid transport system permease protein
MTLAIGVIVSGIALGLLIGLLAFILVFLNKTTGVPNFAIGNVGMFETFLVYELYKSGMDIYVAVVLGLLCSVVFGALFYQIIMRPFNNGGSPNLLVRTVGMYLLLAAMADVFFGQNQPYTFPEVLPTGTFKIASVVINWSDVATAAFVVLISIVFVAMFRYTKLGLQFMAVAQRAPTARLLGVRVTRLSMIAYMIAAPLALVITLFIAPSQLLSDSTMDSMLLYAFAAAVVGGFQSLPGAFVGGIFTGVAVNLVSTYVGGDLALASALALMIVTLAIRPNGIFGTPEVARL